MTRDEQLSDALGRLRSRIESAARSAGRDPRAVRLLAVTKTFPAADAASLLGLGMLDLAENRDAEAAAKVAEVRELRPDTNPRWHMVGRLQRNKARSVVRWAEEVQSVDSSRLAVALAEATARARDSGDRAGPLDVLIQVSLDGAAGRGGCPLTDVRRLADEITLSSELRLRGLMAVAPLGQPPAPAFESLALASEQLRAEHPDAVEVSAGMSGDLEEAILHGSTCVRVGTGLLGDRRLTSP